MHNEGIIGARMHENNQMLFSGPNKNINKCAVEIYELFSLQKWETLT